jgi:hypothetical protein
VVLAEWKIETLDHSVLFLKEADIALTNDDWRVAIDLDLSVYHEVISTIRTDLHAFEILRQEFTSISELKQVGILLQTLDSKLREFNKFLARLDRRRGLLNLGGTVLKTLFGTATISDIQELHSTFGDLKSKNTDIVHSLENQLPYVKRQTLDTDTLLHIYYASQIQEHRQPWTSIAAFYLSIIAILGVLYIHLHPHTRNIRCNTSQQNNPSHIPSSTTPDLQPQHLNRKVKTRKQLSSLRRIPCNTQLT